MPKLKNESLHLYVFYALNPDFVPCNGLLCEEESHHTTPTLRLSVKEQIFAEYGRGQIFECRIIEQVN